MVSALHRFKLAVGLGLVVGLMAPRPAAAAQAGFEPVTLPKHDAVPVCLAIGQGASPSLYVGTTDGQVFASHDGARSWHGGPLVASVSPLPPRSHLRAAFSVTYAGRIYGEDSVAGQYNGAVTVDGGQVFGFSAAESQFEDPIGSGSGFIQAALLSEIGSGGGTHVVDGSPPPPYRLQQGLWRSIPVSIVELAVHPVDSQQAVVRRGDAVFATVDGGHSFTRCLVSGARRLSVASSPPGFIIDTTAGPRFGSARLCRTGFSTASSSPTSVVAATEVPPLRGERYVLKSGRLYRVRVAPLPSQGSPRTVPMRDLEALKASAVELLASPPSKAPSRLRVALPRLSDGLRIAPLEVSADDPSIFTDRPGLEATTQAAGREVPVDLFVFARWDLMAFLAPPDVRPDPLIEGSSRVARALTELRLAEVSLPGATAQDAALAALRRDEAEQRLAALVLYSGHNAKD